MDVFERFSSKFGQWYEGLFGAGTGELRPRDVLRKITTSMEDNRKEGLDGKVYVPNRYVLELAVSDPEERDYLLSFLDEEELVGVLQKFLTQNNYNIRGPLDFTIAEVEMGVSREKLRVKARFEKGAVDAAPVVEQPLPGKESAATPVPPLQPISKSGPEQTQAKEPVRAHHLELNSVRNVDRDEMPTVAAAPAVDEDDLATVPAVALAALAMVDVDGRKSHFSLTKPVTTIGRSRTSGNDIVLTGDGMASKQHGRIEREVDGRFTLYDLGSTNGITVNQQRIDGSRTLVDGDEIVIGATRLVFQQAGDFARKNAAPVVDTKPTGMSTGAPAARLISSQGDEYVLGSDTLIGRALTADLVLDDASVSTRHARIVSTDPATYYLEDLGSEHGTKINGLVLPKDQRALLADGDVVVFGMRILQFAGSRS